MSSPHGNYGIDAPSVVYSLGLGGVALIVLSLMAAKVPLVAPIAPTLSGTGVGMILGCVWMIVSSLWLKRLVMSRLLGERVWRGDEAVLDVGAGRGLLAIGAARRLSNGKVYAIDIWQSRDLSGNTPKALLANARAAGAIERLQVDTGDARSLPYTDGMFDVVGSMTAIHNIAEKE